MNISHRLTLILAATLLVIGCDKGVKFSGDSDNAIKYKVSFASVATKSSGTSAGGGMLVLSDKTGSVSVPMTGDVSGWSGDGCRVVTKGQLVNETGADDTPQEYGIEEFFTGAYDGTSPLFSVEKVEYNGVASKWEMENIYYWPANESLDFYAYANLPDESAYTSVSIAETGVTLSGYNIPEAASEQNDILLGSYHGYGFGTGTAEIRFEHPLTAVRFLYGYIEGNPGIKSITLKGVAASGTAAMDSDAIIEWSDVTDYSHTVSQTNASGLSLTTLSGRTAQLIGEPFIIIPQNLADNNVTVTVTLDDDTVIEAMLSTGEWRAGYTNTYTLGYDPHTYSYSFSASELSHSFNNTTSPETRTISITSERVREDLVVSPAEWQIKSVQVGSGVVQNVKASSFEDKGGLSASVTASGLSVTASARSSASIAATGSNNYWRNQSPVRSDNLDWSPADWSSQGSIDLSKMDFSKDNPSDAINAHEMTTANCYVIRHAGHYKLPLVYGNAVDGGITNEKSYYPNVSGGTNRLDRFENAWGHGIASPFIENDASNAGEYLYCAVIWQDKGEVITHLQLSTDAADLSHVYTKDDVRYLEFDISQEAICQNNALICVYKDKIGGVTNQYDPGEAIWSWHIWTTNDPSLLDGPISIWNDSSPSVEYKFFPIYCLGWLDASNYTQRDDVKIVLEQKKSGNEIELTVKQNTVIIDASCGCWYQFGRKDPMCTTDEPADGSFAKVSGPVGLSDAISNPEEFYQNDNGTWLSGTAYYNLWTGKMSAAGTSAQAQDQNDNMIKTVYDPSPVGYKMPASKAFASLTADNYEGGFSNGYYFYSRPGKQGQLVFFPTAGSRNAIGIINSYTSGGYYWSAIPNNDIRSYRLNFTSTNNNNYYTVNAYGLSVRPVKEP